MKTVQRTVVDVAHRITKHVSANSVGGGTMKSNKIKRRGIGQIKGDVKWELKCACCAYFERFDRWRFETKVNPNTGRKNYSRYTVNKTDAYDKAIGKGWTVAKGKLLSLECNIA